MPNRERRGRSDVYVPRLGREQYLDARARNEVSAPQRPLAATQTTGDPVFSTYPTEVWR